MHAKKLLYANTFCAYRDKYMGRIICRHKYSYGVCDLDLCPIVNDYYANVVFQEEGIVLVVKRPSGDSVAGMWERYNIEISPELDNEDDIIKFCMEKTNGVPEIIRKKLQEKIHALFERWRFLKSRGKKIGAIETEKKVAEEEITIGEELLEEIKEVEKEIES